VSLIPVAFVIVEVQVVRNITNAGFRIIPTQQPSDFGNGNCIQTESFHVTTLTALKINCQDKDQTKRSEILPVRKY